MHQCSRAAGQPSGRPARCERIAASAAVGRQIMQRTGAGWDLGAYQDWLATTCTRLATPPPPSSAPPVPPES
jgi:hypothetical protein